MKVRPHLMLHICFVWSKAAGFFCRSQDVIVLLTQKVSQTPLKANLRPNKFLFRPN